MSDNPISGDFEVIPDGRHDPPTGEPYATHDFGDRVPDEYIPLRLNISIAFGVDVEVCRVNDTYHIYPQEPKESGDSLLIGAVKPSGAAVSVGFADGRVQIHGPTRNMYYRDPSAQGKGTGFQVIGGPEEFEIKERRYLGK